VLFLDLMRFCATCLSNHSRSLDAKDRPSTFGIGLGGGRHAQHDARRADKRSGNVSKHYTAEVY